MVQDLGHIDDEIIIRDEEGKLQRVAGSDIEDLEEIASKKASNQTDAFDETDAKEINGFKKSMPKVLDSNLDFGKIVDKIITAVKIKFDDVETQEQLRNVLLSRFRDVRDIVEIKTTLLRPVRLGGLGLKIGKADQVCDILEEEIQKLNEIAQNHIEYSDDKDLAKPLAIEVKVSEKPKLVFEKNQRVRDQIQYQTKLVGPVEELQNLTVVDFRRLGKNPREATEKIFDKIKLLRQDSFVDGIKAMKAWQKSPLNQIYLELGEQSLNDSQNLEEVISQRKDQNEDYLTIDEFKAIMDFNKKIRS